MKTQTIGALAVAALIVAAGAAWLASTPRTAAPDPRQRPALVPDLASKGASIRRVTVRQGDAVTTLERAGDRWVVASKGGYPASESAVRDLLRSIDGATVADVKTSNPEFYPRLGVEDPAAPGAASTGVVIEGEGATPIASIIVGKAESGAQSSDDSVGRFARRAGEAASLLVRGLGQVRSDTQHYLDRDIGAIENERVMAAGVSGAPGGAYTVSRASAEDTAFTLTPMPEGRSLKDQFVLTRLANVMAFMTLDDVLPAGGVFGEGEIAEGTPTITAELRTFDGLVVRIRTTEKDAKTWAAFSAEATDGASAEIREEAARLNEKWSGWAYQLPAYKNEVLRGPLESLLAPAGSGADADAGTDALPGPVRIPAEAPPPGGQGPDGQPPDDQPPAQGGTPPGGE
ncbi:MAG: DUF4340 domain-containing protein [Planctomycetota bacterium]|nr:DUF4340 domain-containing protein [Planctomycetota bacterium]